MLTNLNQPKGSTIGVLRDGRTVQEAFDGLNGSLTLADIRSLTFTKVGEEVTIGEHTAGQGMGGGLKLYVELPGDPSATVAKNYSVEIEIQ